MADSGKNAAFTFGGTVYDADDCVSGWRFIDRTNAVEYTCNGLDKVAAGTRNLEFNATLALAAADTTKHAALDSGSTGAFEAHPAGDTATYIEITATDALVVSNTMSAPTNGIIAMDVVIRLQDVTIGAAT